jgi:ubiquinone/menaquinone biosynthesis C-methylase UbiE
MLDVEKFLSATVEELEGLPYYELLARLGILSFNSQGGKPMDLIAEYAGLSAAGSALVLGCGAGATAIRLAEKTGAMVRGIDLAPGSIQEARSRAAASSARERLEFRVGDASALPFAANSFDVLITEYMAFFLKPSAFSGFLHTLKPGGFIALAEIVKDPNVGAMADARILSAEALYSELLGYPFHIPRVNDYLGILEGAGFEDVRIKRRFENPGLRESVRGMGGWRNLFRISAATLRLMSKSPTLRKRFLQAGRVKDTLIKNPTTARYIFQALIMGRKPGN